MVLQLKERGTDHLHFKWIKIFVKSPLLNIMDTILPPTGRKFMSFGFLDSIKFVFE